MFVCKLVVCKPIQFSADSTILCQIVNVFICFVYMSICSIYWCFLDDFCMFSIMSHITYIMSLCIAGLHVTVIVHICPSLLLFSALLGTFYGESVSYCFSILSIGSSVFQVIWSL